MARMVALVAMAVLGLPAVAQAGSGLLAGGDAGAAGQRTARGQAPVESLARTAQAGDQFGTMPGPAPGTSVGTASPPSGGAPGIAGTGTATPRKPLRRAKLRRRCSRHRHTRTCRYLRGVRLVKKCVKRRHHKERCRRHRLASSTSVRENSGWVDPAYASTVRIYFEINSDDHPSGRNVCSGSLLTNGLVLTAGHCVYSNAVDGVKRGGVPYVGYFDYGKMIITPGQRGTSAPYGNYSVRNMWTTQAYADSQLGSDWAIIQVNPDADGVYPGQRTGTTEAAWNYTVPDGTEFYLNGYPLDGGFSLPMYGSGNFQYFCQERWYRSGGAALGYNKYGFDFDPCEMTGGSSGGPVYVRFSDGKWRIGGVVNRGSDRPGSGPDQAHPFGRDLISFYFDSDFGAFWSSVYNQVNSG